jgi:hypothetical protein
MLSKQRLLALLAVIACALATSMANADEVRLPARSPRPIDQPAIHVPIGPATFFGGLCSLGGPQSANQELDFFQDDDSYFTLLEPSTCLECAATGTMTVDAIHIGINFIVGCTMPVEVSIV